MLYIFLNNENGFPFLLSHRADRSGSLTDSSCSLFVVASTVRSHLQKDRKAIWDGAHDLLVSFVFAWLAWQKGKAGALPRVVTPLRLQTYTRVWDPPTIPFCRCWQRAERDEGMLLISISIWASKIDPVRFVSRGRSARDSVSDNVAFYPPAA